MVPTPVWLWFGSVPPPMSSVNLARTGFWLASPRKTDVTELEPAQSEKTSWNSVNVLASVPRPRPLWLRVINWPAT